MTIMKHCAKVQQKTLTSETNQVRQAEELFEEQSSHFKPEKHDMFVNQQQVSSISHDSLR